MRFRDFLLAEKAMNSKTFTDTRTRLGQSVQVGYEFELIVPDHSVLYDDSTVDNDDRNSQVISFYDDIDEFEEMFHMDSRKRREIERDLDTWIDDQREEYSKDNWEDYKTDDNTEAEAKAEAADHAPTRDYDFRHWLKDEFRYTIDFVDTYHLEPKYGWYTDSGRHASIYTEPVSEDEPTGSITHVQTTLRDALPGSPSIIIFKDRHEHTKNSNSWYLEPDPSISGDGPDDHGVEIVSPPEPLDASLNTMNTVFKWMKKNNLETNKSTGLHINVSIKGIDLNEKLDPVKLILFMGEKYSADLFNRAQNSTAAPQIDAMISRIRSDGKLPEDAEALIDNAYRYLANDKYKTVNLSKLSSGYIEFRIAGGENYHYDYTQARDLVLRFVTALELACDPDAERREYMKKISKFFDKVKDTNSYKSTDLGTFPKELRRIYILDKRVAADYNKAIRAVGDLAIWRKEDFVNFALKVATIAKNFKSSLDSKEVVYIKQLLKKEMVKNTDVDEALPNSIDRKYFKQVYGI